MEKPKTISRILDALWYAVFGLNDKDGLINMARQQHADMEVIKQQMPELWTKKEHFEERAKDEVKAFAAAKATDDKKDKQTVSVTTWILVACNIVMTIAVVVALFLKG